MTIMISLKIILELKRDINKIINNKNLILMTNIVTQIQMNKVRIKNVIKFNKLKEFERLITLPSNNGVNRKVSFSR